MRTPPVRYLVIQLLRALDREHLSPETQRLVDKVHAAVGTRRGPKNWRDRDDVRTRVH